MAKILKGNEYKSRLDLKERVESDITTPVPSSRPLGAVIDREVLSAEDQAKEIIAQAKKDAEKIRAEAKDLLSQVQAEMKKSKEEGFAAGKEEGLENALEMLVRVKELRTQLFTDNEREIVKLVFEIAKKVIGREFTENDKAILNVIRLALSDAVGDKIMVKVNPEDFEKVKKNEKELLKSIDNSAVLSFREDEEVKPGGCVVDTDIGTIDAQLETQLGAIKKALGL